MSVALMLALITMQEGGMLPQCTARGRGAKVWLCYNSRQPKEGGAIMV